MHQQKASQDTISIRNLSYIYEIMYCTFFQGNERIELHAMHPNAFNHSPRTKSNGAKT